MILTAYESERDTQSDVFHQMYELRARQFAERRGWRVVVEDGLEKDRFDDMNPLYICVITDDRRLLASLRLLPTTGPHMLSDVFPEVMGDAGIIRHPLNRLERSHTVQRCRPQALRESFRQQSRQPDDLPRLNPTERLRTQRR
jgi:N-acyl-L-homoserine lactone synthetase